MAVLDFTFNKDELQVLELEIMLAVNERLYRRQLISEDAYTRAKAAILSS